MSLADLIRGKSGHDKFATATPATFATPDATKGRTVATVATVAVANTRNPMPEAAYDPATEARRNKVLAMLAADAKLHYAISVMDPDTDPVVVAVGIRNTVTLELEIPHAFYDPCTLLELLDKHSRVAQHE